MREEDIILDIFRVCTTDFRPVSSAREIERIEKLIAREFGLDADIDFHKLIEKNKKPSPFRDEIDVFEIPQRVFVSNELDTELTILEIQAQDRIGLLYDIFTVLGNSGADVIHARISTQSGAAIDRLHLADSATGVKFEKEKLPALEKAVADALKI